MKPIVRIASLVAALSFLGAAGCGGGPEKLPEGSVHSTEVPGMPGPEGAKTPPTTPGAGPPGATPTPMPTGT
jgi:hypothetical protein